jgi:hypothetical protein
MAGGSLHREVDSAEVNAQGIDLPPGFRPIARRELRMISPCSIVRISGATSSFSR